MKVLITGITGFVGRSMLRYIDSLNQRDGGNLEVVGVSSSSIGHRELEAKYRFLSCHIWDLTKSTFPLDSIDAILHFASPASASLIRDYPRETFQTLVVGAQNLIDSITSSANQPKLLMASSGAVYDWGLSRTTPVVEDDLSAPSPLSQNACYAEGKRAVELLFSIADERGVLDLKVARMFAFFGLDLPIDRHYAIGNFVRDVVRGNPVSILGNPTTIRSYMWAEDMAEWLFTILVRGEKRRVYHVGSENLITISDLASKVAGIARIDFGIEVDVIQDFRGTQLPRSIYLPSTERTRNELQLSETWDLETGIKLMIAHNLEARWK